MANLEVEDAFATLRPKYGAQNAYQSALSSMPPLWQQADALALQRLDALLSLEA